MKPENKKIKYFLYARKSSESEDRQVQSIDDQVNRLKNLAREWNLDVIKIYSEAKSAKMPNNRPVFDEMMAKIENGEADGILCWTLNRLSRNPIDSGKLSWLLQKGILKSIQTIERQYLPSDNVLLFNVESGMANQYLLDLSRDTKRGLQKKLDDGWLPNLAPTGYLNNKENHTIIEDPERFDLVRKMFDLMLTGNYTPPQILTIANNEWGFRTRKSKKIGGNPLAYSSIYRIFSNIFYAGLLDRNGQVTQGQHRPMITLEEFDRIQMLLGRKGRPRPQEHHFAFTGSIRCGVCGCLYTAQTKKKLLKDGTINEHTYYHCTRRTRKVECNQKEYIPLEDLEVMIEKEVEKYTILPEFLHWALEGASKQNDTEIQDRTKIYEMQQKAYNQAQAELDELGRMRYRQMVSDEFYLKEKSTLELKLKQLKEDLGNTEVRAEKWRELNEKVFAFSTYARAEFLRAGKMGKTGLERKKEILVAIGKFPIIQDKKLTIEPNEWFVPIENGYPELEAEYLRLEPTKTGDFTNKTEALASVRTRWLRR